MAVTIQLGQKGAHYFLKNHAVGVLATVTPSGEPHAAAIYYFIDSAFSISFVTKTHTKKADNLRHNNHAVLVVYEPASQTSVQVSGAVSEVTNILEVNKIFTQAIYASIETSKSSVPPLAKLKEGDYIAYRLKPELVNMAIFSSPKSGEYHDLFKTFVPGKG